MATSLLEVAYGSDVFLVVVIGDINPGEGYVPRVFIADGVADGIAWLGRSAVQVLPVFIEGQVHLADLDMVVLHLAVPGQTLVAIKFRVVVKAEARPGEPGFGVRWHRKINGIVARSANMVAAEYVLIGIVPVAVMVPVDPTMQVGIGDVAADFDFDLTLLPWFIIFRKYHAILVSAICKWVWLAVALCIWFAPHPDLSALVGGDSMPGAVFSQRGVVGIRRVTEVQLKRGKLNLLLEGLGQLGEVPHRAYPAVLVGEWGCIMPRLWPHYAASQPVDLRLLDANALGVEPVAGIGGKTQFVDKVSARGLSAGPRFRSVTGIPSCRAVAAAVGLAIGDDVYRLHQVGVISILGLVVDGNWNPIEPDCTRTIVVCGEANL